MALLITEVFNEDCEVLVEANDNGSKSHYVTGIFMQGDLRNRNGRVYPSAILDKELKRYDEQFIKTKRALGELGHPDGPQINGDRVSHLITEMTRDGSNFIGKAKILSTPMGNIVKTFIDEGVRIGVSTRGLGSVKQTREGIMEVQNDFHLATVDIVTDPSGPDCFVDGIMENTQYFFDIATATWKPGMATESTTNASNSDDMKALYEAAMARLQKLEDVISGFKASPTKKTLSESEALSLFNSYIDTLKK